MTKIVALIDGSIYTGSVCDHAAWIAQRLAASVDIVHVLDRRGISGFPVDLSGNLGASAQVALLEELAELGAQKMKLAQKQGDLLLDEARRRMARHELQNIVTHLKRGDLIDVIEEIEDEARLLVVGKRGEGADFAKMHLGSNIERIARHSRKPIFVASRAFKPIERFLIAFDGGPHAQRAVEHIAQSPVLRGLPCKLLMAGSPAAGYGQQLQAAATLLATAGCPVETQIEPGDPDTVIARAVEQDAIDLLVMGAYGHSRIRNLIIGSTTTAMIRSCLVPVFMFR